MTRGGFLRVLALLGAATPIGSANSPSAPRRVQLLRSRKLPPGPLYITQDDMTRLWRKMQLPLREASNDVVREYDAVRHLYQGFDGSPDE